MRIFRYLFWHKGALCLVFALLALLAACNLALPYFTSNIVDVGIQQSGVEDVATEVMTQDTHDALLQKLSGDDKELFEESYSKDGDLWRLTDIGHGNLGKLDQVLAKPLVEVYEASGKLAGADDQAQSASATSPADISDSESSMVHMRAIAASIQEYEAAGFDLGKIRMGYLLKTGLAMVGVAALAMLLDVLIAFVASRTGARIGNTLRSRLFGNVVSFTEREVSRFSAASLITRGTNDIQLIQNVSIMLMRMVLYAPVIAIGGAIMVIVTGPSLGWVVVTAILVIFAAITILFKITLPKFKIMQKLIDKVNLIARETLEGMPAIRTFGREQYEFERFDRASRTLRDTQLFTNRAMTFMMPTMMLVMNLTSVAIVWFGSFQVQDGNLQTGDLIAFITYSMVMIMGCMILGMMAIMLPRANVAAHRVDEVLHTKPAIGDSPDAIPDPCGNSDADGTKEGCSKGATVSFQNVSFCYSDDDDCELALDDVSFSVHPGETLAIVGATGSGKSTILKLIERFYDPDDGRVLLDGIDVKDLKVASLRQQIGFVPQKSFLFAGTVRSNVAYSDANMPLGQIDSALDVAQASKFVSEREGGIDSEISQGGTNVSGGQRQRLAIARALAKKGARLLMFDDSFNALDYATDAALRHALQAELGGITCIIVAQRIATVINADRIIVLSDGRIVGQGTHDELMKANDEYRKIAEAQLTLEELDGGGEAA